MNDDFTPGPWVLYDTSAGQSMRVGLPYKGAPSQTIALVIRPVGTTDDEQVANARLISSAPETAAERDRLLIVNAELLQALQRLILGDERDRADGLHLYQKGSPRDKTWDAARAAIAKATGGTP